MQGVNGICYHMDPLSDQERVEIIKLFSLKNICLHLKVKFVFLQTVFPDRRPAFRCASREISVPLGGCVYRRWHPQWPRRLQGPGQGGQDGIHRETGHMGTYRGGKI